MPSCGVYCDEVELVDKKMDSPSKSESSEVHRLEVIAEEGDSSPNLSLQTDGTVEQML